MSIAPVMVLLIRSGYAKESSADTVYGYTRDRCLGSAMNNQARVMNWIHLLFYLNGVLGCLPTRIKLLTHCPEVLVRAGVS